MLYLPQIFTIYSYCYVLHVLCLQKIQQMYNSYNTPNKNKR